jgi:hypothetical protein
MSLPLRIGIRIMQSIVALPGFKDIKLKWNAVADLTKGMLQDLRIRMFTMDRVGLLVMLRCERRSKLWPIVGGDVSPSAPVSQRDAAWLVRLQ